MKTIKNIYLNQALTVGQELRLAKPVQHRLLTVLRLREGAELEVFNGQDGTFLVQLGANGVLNIQHKLADLEQLPPKHLLLGLPKRDAWESALRQATELGATHIHPLLSQHCVADKVNTERALSLIVEAAEQCERNTLPELLPLQRLQAGVEGFKAPLMWAHARLEQETEQQTKPGTSVQGNPPFEGVLIGPEGGFSKQEEVWLSAQPHVRPVQFARHVLRSDTAVVAGLALV